MGVGDSGQQVQEGQQVSHVLGIRLEAGHGRRAAADHLLDQLAIVLAVIDAMEVGPHQTLGGQAMATGAIETEELAAADIIPFERQGGAAIGVPGARLQESRQQ